MKNSVLVGNVYGKLTVAELKKEMFRGYNQTFASCTCDCGNIKNFELVELYKNKKTDCGCLVAKKRQDLKENQLSKVLGEKIHNITIIKSFYYKDKLCINYQCNCGNINTNNTNYNDVIRGKLKSCGCYSKKIASERRQKSEETLKFLIGNIHEDLKILQCYYTNDNSIRSNSLIVDTICKCGNEKTMTYEDFKKVRSCGCREHERKFIYNTDFFKTLTPSCAYTLGLIYSDGCLHKNTFGCTISLQEGDQSVLKKISKLVKNTEDLLFYKKSKINHQNKRVFNIHNKDIYTDLLSWNLTPKKSKTLTVDQRLKHDNHFMRGMFDGDGCIYIEPNKTNTNNTLIMSICGTIDICESFKNWCNTTGSKSKANVRLVKEQNNFAVYFVKGKNAEIILEELYKDANDLYIDRKYDKFQEYKLNKIYKVINNKNDSKNI